jgi:hypothetical protein
VGAEIGGILQGGNANQFEGSGHREKRLKDRQKSGLRRYSGIGRGTRNSYQAILDW